MSIDRDAVVIPAKGSNKSETEIITEIEDMEALDDEQLYAKFARVLSRSVILDRLKVDLPPNVYGEWIHENNVREAEAMGFTIDREYAPKGRGNLHDDGTGVARISDVVHMIMPRRFKEAIERVKEDQRRSNVDPKSKREESEFSNQVRAETGGIIPTFQESDAKEAGAQDISDALDALSKQRRG